jgi:hypothetical protein
MNLSDISSEDFGTFVHWLYFQKIELDGTSLDVNILPLARLWVLGGRFRVAKLQNKVMDKLRVLVEGVEGGTLKGFLNFCYAGKERAELRKLAADRMAWTTTLKGLEAWIFRGHLPDGMLIDIVLALKKDHVPGKPSVKFNFGEAGDYYVELKENEDETKLEVEGEGS